MIPARPSPDKSDPEVRRKNRKFLLLALMVSIICAADLAAILWLVNE